MTETSADTPERLTEAHVMAWARMARATTAVLQAVEEALKRHALPPLAWYDLLLELRRAAPEGLRPVRLQAEMLIPQYNMSRLLDRVDSAGYISRRACDGDARGQVVRITEAGEELLRRMWPVYRQALASAFAAEVGEQEARQMAQLLTPFSVASR